MKVLKTTQFGNPVLRRPAKQVSQAEIGSPRIQNLLRDMKQTLKSVKLGVGLAAPQVGEPMAVAVIVIQPTAHRPEVEPWEMVLINPVITETFGNRKQLWEGCISSGATARTGLFAKVPRYVRIKVRYYDQSGKLRHSRFEGLKAHIIQHEIDHLNGILFPERVKDHKTYMTYGEYLKYVKAKKVP